VVSVLKLSLISYEQRSMSRPDRARTRQSGKNNSFETIDDEIEIRRHVPVSVCSCSASCLASVIELVPSRQQQSLARSNDTHLPRSFFLKMFKRYRERTCFSCGKPAPSDQLIHCCEQRATQSASAARNKYSRVCGFSIDADKWLIPRDKKFTHFRRN